jgi:DNA invertase Pin-like site-specific DNA recombinase
VGRPKKQVDKEKLRNLAMIGCSHELIATELGISHDTLTRRFREVIEEAR